MSTEIWDEDAAEWVPFVPAIAVRVTWPPPEAHVHQGTRWTTEIRAGFLCRVGRCSCCGGEHSAVRGRAVR